MKNRREDLVRHLRHRFNALLAVSFFSWLTMAGVLLYVWLHGHVLGLDSLLWFVSGFSISMLQLVFLVVIATKLHSTMKVRSSLLTNLEYESEHDPLTGLINRRGFDICIKHALFVARRQEKPLSLLYLDLDGFKKVNDLHGHAVGDRLLQAVSKSWASVTRNGDVLARLGGDEFVLLSSATGREAEIVAERFLEVAKANLMEGFPGLLIGVSIGISEFPRNAQDAGSLVLTADSAMLKAKALGKSCFQWASQSTTANS